MATHKAGLASQHTSTKDVLHEELKASCAEIETSVAAPIARQEEEVVADERLGADAELALSALQRDGFHIFPQRLPLERLESLRAAFDARLDGGSASGEVDLGCPWTDETVAPFLEVLQDESLVRVLAKMCGSPFVALRLELFVKGPRSGTAIPWHQDTFTTHTGFSWTAEAAAEGGRPHPATLWVALDDTSTENGGMQFAPGRHRELLNGPNGAVPEEAISADRRVDYEMAAGQAGLHHPLAPHQSCPNTSDRIRRAFLVRFSPWTDAVERQCGTPSEVRERAATNDWPQWRSSPESSFVWTPGNEKALSAGRALNRMLVCFEQSS